MRTSETRKAVTRRSLVVDASVARAAGGADAVHPTSTSCRDFLMAMLDICHRVVRTDAIGDEWKRNRSKFFRGWLVNMYGRKKVDQIQPPEHGLQTKLSNALANPLDRATAMKDVHLLDAAIATRSPIVSHDETSRALFASTCAKVPELQRIVWINPCTVQDAALEWLDRGAPDEKPRMLGAGSEKS